MGIYDGSALDTLNGINGPELGIPDGIVLGTLDGIDNEVIDERKLGALD